MTNSMLGDFPRGNGPQVAMATLEGGIARDV